MWRLLIRSCQSEEGVMINAFFSKLNNVNLHLEIKPRPFYKIMKGFIYPKDY